MLKSLTISTFQEVQLAKNIKRAKKAKKKVNAKTTKIKNKKHSI